MWVEVLWTCLQNICQIFETMFYQFFRKESIHYLPAKHAPRTNSRNIIGKNPSMVIPLLANEDLTPMLIQIMTTYNLFF